MFDYVENCRQGDDFQSLDRKLIKQFSSIKFSECLIGFAQRLSQTIQELWARHYLTLSELCVTIACVGSTPQSDDDPLPDIAAQMKQQVAYAVR